ncbi:hypothetical protein EON63_14590 [archaeon]|nr:MAG: hypothetical protein EON63_14590 [archaeon]
MLISSNLTPLLPLQATSAVYFRRFYQQHVLAEHDPRTVMLACIFLASTCCMRIVCMYTCMCGVYVYMNVHVCFSAHNMF